MKQITPPESLNRVNYSSLNGLRAYAAVGIVMMHVQANMAIKPSANVLTERVIPWFTDFTLLFMVISAFSMCCGYYERIKTGAITPAKFYSKRYSRIWPFFALMVAIAFAMEPSWGTFCQAFADLTMCFNLLPNPQIEVVGVGWFLGTVFTFYLLFPFFTYLLDSKRRGWLVVLLSLLFCYIGIDYFHNTGRGNIIYSAPFFIAGGMVYLYRERLQRIVEAHTIITLLLALALTTAMLAIPMDALFVIPSVVVFTAWLIYAIGSKDVVLNNRIVKYLSGISMEIYLCHMMFYRVVERLHIERFIEDNDLLYILSVLTTLAGAICFSHIVKYKVFTKLHI